MKPQIRFDRTVVTVNKDERVNTLVTLTAPPALNIDRPPLDVAFVIDNSGSMAGQPLAVVTEAVANVLRLLGPDDRASVMTFADSAHLVLPLGRHNDARAQSELRRIRSGGGTNLSAGWLMGLEILRADQRAGAIRRIVVLTDGRTNSGVVDTDLLCDMVSAGRRSQVTTSCIGFGAGFDEELLGSLANAGAGNDYFCDSPDAAVPLFRREFEGLAAVVAQNLAVSVYPTDVVAAASVLNDFAVVPLEGLGLRVEMGDCFGDETRSVLLSFATRPQPTDGSVHVADIALSWVSTTEGFAMHEVRIPVTITAGESGMVDNGADPDVEAEVMLLEAASERREMRRLADSGDLQNSLLVGRRALDRLRHLADQQAVADQLETELTMIEHGGWNGLTSKMSYSASREMSRKRASYEASLGGEPDRSEQSPTESG